MDWIDLAQDRDRWRALVYAVMSLDIVGRYSVPTRTCYLTKKIFYQLHY